MGVHFAVPRRREPKELNNVTLMTTPDVPAVTPRVASPPVAGAMKFVVGPETVTHGLLETRSRAAIANRD